MNSRLERLLIALMFALLAAGVTLIMASAQGENPPAPQAQTSPECVACHTEFQATWEKGAHGQAAGVTCESCHGSLLPDHPKTQMPVNRSPELCASCHSVSSFRWQDWKASKHSESGLDCATCHDPHSAALKKLPGPRDVAKNIDEVSALCINCHKESNMKFSLTVHAQKGISCAECHVNHVENTDKTAQNTSDHSFKASLNSCNTCHAQQMHSPTRATSPEGITAPVSAKPNQGVELASVVPEPDPVSPIGFSALAGLIGLAGGMVLAPWLERWYQRAIKHNSEEDHERQA